MTAALVAFAGVLVHAALAGVLVGAVLACAVLVVDLAPVGGRRG